MTGVALILFGTLLGVLASRFLPMSPSAPFTENVGLNPEVNPSETGLETSPVIEITLPPAPTATPSSLLNLRWNMMTVRSPLPLFTSYQFYYPTIWSIKEYRNFPSSKDGGNSTLTLIKGTTTLTIRQAPGEVSECLFPADPDGGEMTVRYSDFRSLIKRDIITWRWAKKVTDDTSSIFDVCESISGGKYTSPTSIGYLTVISPTAVDAETLDEINFILEKIVILK